MRRNDDAQAKNLSERREHRSEKQNLRSFIYSKCP